MAKVGKSYCVYQMGYHLQQKVGNHHDVQACNLLCLFCAGSDCPCDHQADLLMPEISNFCDKTKEKCTDKIICFSFLFKYPSPGTCRSESPKASS